MTEHSQHCNTMMDCLSCTAAVLIVRQPQQQQQQPPPPQLLPSPQQQQHSALPVLLKSQQKWDGSTGANPVTGVISCTPWSELSECVVGRIALFLSSSARDVLLLASACRCWRRAVLENDALLATLHFALKDPLQPLRRGAGMELLASSRTTAARTCQQLLQPELLVRVRLLLHLVPPVHTQSSYPSPLHACCCTWLTGVTRLTPLPLRRLLRWATPQRLYAVPVFLMLPGNQRMPCAAGAVQPRQAAWRASSAMVQRCTVAVMAFHKMHKTHT